MGQPNYEETGVRFHVLFLTARSNRKTIYMEASNASVISVLCTNNFLRWKGLEELTRAQELTFNAVSSYIAYPAYTCRILLSYVWRCWISRRIQRKQSRSQFPLCIPLWTSRQKVTEVEEKKKKMKIKVKKQQWFSPRVPRRVEDNVFFWSSSYIQTKNIPRVKPRYLLAIGPHTRTCHTFSILSSAYCHRKLSVSHFQQVMFLLSNWRPSHAHYKCRGYTLGSITVREK